MNLELFGRGNYDTLYMNGQHSVDIYTYNRCVKYAY